MSEWQPAIVINAHDLAYARMKHWAGKKVRVGKRSSPWKSHHPCEGQGTWYDVHPDDVSILSNGMDGVVLCEHEILTD